jgi:hypothetical protein
MLYYKAWIVNILFGLLVAAGSARAAEAPSLPVYSYPFSDGVLAQDLRLKPIFLELFTSLDCLFCPRAEELLTDMVAQTKAVVLACHTDPEGRDYPLAREFCAIRQERYSAVLASGLMYTPQLVVNGAVDAAGHEFDDVRLALTRGLERAPAAITFRPSTQEGVWLVDLPNVTIKNGADIFAITYRPPTTVPKTMRQSLLRPYPLVRVATRLTPLGGFDGRARTLSLPFTPSDDAAGVVVLIEQADRQIIAVGDLQP